MANLNIEQKKVKSLFQKEVFATSYYSIFCEL